MVNHRYVGQRIERCGKNKVRSLSFPGQLLRGFLENHLDDNSLAKAEQEFYVPSTRNDTIIAMNRLFRFFSESNQILSAGDGNGGSENFRLGFLPDPKTHHLRAFLFTVNMNVSFNSYSVQHSYYQKLQSYFEQRLEQLRLSEGTSGHVYEQVKHG